MKDQRSRLRYLVRHSQDPAPAWLRELHPGSTVWECLVKADDQDGPVDELIDRLMGITKEDLIQALQETACKRSQGCFLDSDHLGPCRIEISGFSRSQQPPSDPDLVTRVVHNAGLRLPPMTRWVRVRDAFAVGSTSAVALCRRFNLDPDETIGVEDDD